MSTQDEPIEDGPTVDDHSKVEGLLAQIAHDAAAGHLTNVREELRTRLSDMKMQISPEEFEQLVARLG